MKIPARNRIPRSRQLYWSAIFIMLLAGGLFGLGAFVFSPNWLNTAGILPITLHSPLRADYSANLRSLRPLAFGLGLVGEAERDLAATPVEPDDLAARLQTPVPTATPFPTGASTLAATPFPSATSNNPPGSTPTLMPSASASPAASFTPSATIPTRTAIILPSSTPTATSTPTTGNLDPTSTKVPPTSTVQQPTSTRVPPTATRIPPTNTPKPPPTQPPPTQPPPTSYPPPPPPDPTSNPYP